MSAPLFRIHRIADTLVSMRNRSNYSSVVQTRTPSPKEYNSRRNMEINSESRANEVVSPSISKTSSKRVAPAEATWFNVYWQKKREELGVNEFKYRSAD